MLRETTVRNLARLQNYLMYKTTYFLSMNYFDIAWNI